MRSAIYARFSTDLQTEKSVDDQVALCRSYASREGLRVVSVFSDQAKSGASIFGRDGLLALMLSARRQEFDVLLVEHADRLARSMRDLADIHEKLAFQGIKIRAVHSGATLDTALVGLFGLVGQMQREDGAKKVRRGMLGVVSGGRHAGGRAYGYRAVPGAPGHLEIVREEAEVVRRIFSEYANGRPPRLIAQGLNRDGIKPPRGAFWNASTINGNAQRGSGILLNSLYNGRIVWNKVSMVKNPETGRRVSRPNVADEHSASTAPHLRIVEDELFSSAQALKAAKAKLGSAAKRRPVHLLSGLLRCGNCGAGMCVHDRDERGRARVRCSAVRESGSCSNTRRITLHKIESAVLEGMAEHLRHPALIDAYIRAYNEERTRLAGTSAQDRAKLASQLSEADAALQRVVKNLVVGRLSEDEADRMLPDLRAAKAQAEAALAAANAEGATVTLHPATIGRYLEAVETLAENLADHAHAVDDRGALIFAFRALVDKVVVHASPGSREVEVTVDGRLAALIGGTAFPQNVGGSMVAEEGLEPPTQGL